MRINESGKKVDSAGAQGGDPKEAKETSTKYAIDL